MSRLRIRFQGLPQNLKSKLPNLQRRLKKLLLKPPKREETPQQLEKLEKLLWLTPILLLTILVLTLLFNGMRH